MMPHDMYQEAKELLKTLRDTAEKDLDAGGCGNHESDLDAAKCLFKLWLLFDLENDFTDKCKAELEKRGSVI